MIEARSEVIVLENRGDASFGADAEVGREAPEDVVVSAACVDSAEDTDKIIAKVDEIWSSYPDRTGRLLNVLNDVQETFRYLPAPALSRIGELEGCPVSRLKKMGEFFGYLSLDPVGRVIVDVCDGTACHIQGAPRLVDELSEAFGIGVGETTSDGRITLRKVDCVGACGMAPVVLVEGETFGHVRVSHVEKITQRADELADA